MKEDETKHYGRKGDDDEEDDVAVPLSKPALSGTFDYIQRHVKLEIHVKITCLVSNVAFKNVQNLHTNYSKKSFLKFGLI